MFRPVGVGIDVFWIVAAVVCSLPLAFVISIGWEAHARGWRAISESTRAMYVDGAKTIITTSGIAIALVVSASKGEISVPMWTIRCSVVTLLVSLLSAIATILLLTRGYERAISRAKESAQPNDSEGLLTTAELWAILISGGVTLTTFVLGFLFLGKIVFHMS